MKNLLFTTLLFSALLSLNAQKTFDDPVEEMPKGTVFIFEKEIVIPPGDSTILLGDGVTLFIKPSLAERRISPNRSFTVNGTKFEGINKGSEVDASLWFYVSFGNENIEYLEIHVGERNKKGFVDWTNKTIGDINNLENVKLSLPNIEEF